MKPEIERLLNEFKEGRLQDLTELERLIESGEISLEQIDDFSILQTDLTRMNVPEPSENLKANFYSMLAEEKQKQATCKRKRQKAKSEGRG